MSNRSTRSHGTVRLRFSGLLISVLFAWPVAAQPDAQLLFHWEKRRPRAYEKVHKVLAASDGHVIAVGETLGSGVKDSDGLFLVIEAESGRERLRKPFGGDGDQVFLSAVQHPDGDLTLVGYTKAGGGGARGWIVRVDAEGHLLWEKVLPGKGGGDAAIRDVAISPEGVVLAVGWQNAQQPDGIWLLRIAGDGIFEHTAGGGELLRPEAVAAGADGGFAVAGSTAKENRNRPADAWVMNVDGEGKDRWGGPKFIGDRAGQEGRSIAATIDGGFVLAGATASKGAGMADMWLVKLDRHGNVEWDRTYGGPADDVAADVIELSEGGYAIWGQTWSNMPRARYSTLELVITDARGDERDRNTYAIRQVEAEGNERAHSLVELPGGEIVTAGSLEPNKPNVPGVCQVMAVTYKTRHLTGAPPKPESGGSLRIAETGFHDTDRDQILDAGERGYVFVELSNDGPGNLNDVMGRVTVDPAAAGLDFQEEVSVGTIRAGQKKRLIVPVRAKGAPESRLYQLTIAVHIGGTYAGSSIATIECDGPEPLRATESPAAAKQTAPPPTVSVPDQMIWVSHEPKKEAYNTHSPDVRLRVAAISKNRLEPDKFAVLIGGKRVQGQKMNEADLTPPEDDNGGSVQYYSQVVRLREGQNKVQIVYEGETAFSSPAIVFNYTPLDKPNLYVLSIGVPYPDLKYTVKDASDIAEAFHTLKNDKRVFREVNVYKIVDKETATTFNIKKAFLELSKMRIKNGDLVVVFISSHGKISHDNQFIMLPSDYQSEFEPLLSLNFESDILNRLRNVPGNKLIFIDACHSGQATTDRKDYTDAAASKVLNDLLEATAGLEIFASCGDNEYSYEDDSWGNGAFTKAILEAFAGKTVEAEGGMIRADRYSDNPDTGRRENGSDGVITIGELREFLKLRVPFLVKTVKKEKQNPHNRSTDLLPENTGIFMVRQ